MKETPIKRRLRGYAFDPSLSNRLDTFQINEIVYEIPWEEVTVENGVLKTEYLEIVDYDPSLQKFYKMIDLDDRMVLANNGLNPSESNPMFHQQMVYAVVMTTIHNFENALGRKIHWNTRRLEYNPNAENKHKYEEYVDRLRIYPHALRDANAYYSPEKKALLFGYFHADYGNRMDQLPGSLVFTCLSHDIIAHETTHAILDGLQKYYNEATNADVLAFHEAFADIVALFQHFSFPEVLYHQIAKTRGNLGEQNLLGELAQQFGVAIGNYGSLRDAIGGINPETGKWEPKTPDPMEYCETNEPHARGSILVAAIFDAFLNVYERRVADLYRIATNGTGILPQGDLHPDLVNRLATEAAKTAKDILYMCIRAIDYCPPVDITFGEYIRAIITADMDINPEDPCAYRLALVEAFKRRGIFPTGIKTLSVESLCYQRINIGDTKNDRLIGIIVSFLRDYANRIAYHTDRKVIYDINNASISGSIPYYLRNLMGLGKYGKIIGLHKRIGEKFESSPEFIQLSGLLFGMDFERFGILPSKSSYNTAASFQVHNLKLVSRIGHGSNHVNQVLFSIVQRCGVIMENGTYKGPFRPGYNDMVPEEHQSNGFLYRAGCTLIMDLDTRKLVYAIKKPLVVMKNKTEYEINREAIEEQWRFMTDAAENHINEFQLYFGMGSNNGLTEPFALLHQH